LDPTEITKQILSQAVPRLGHCNFYLAFGGKTLELFISCGYTVGSSGNEYSIIVQGASINYSVIRAQIQQLVTDALKVIEIELPSPVMIKQQPSRLVAKLSNDAVARLILRKDLVALGVPVNKETKNV
jgi:hypothetical protein